MKQTFIPLRIFDSEAEKRMSFNEFVIFETLLKRSSTQS